MIAFDTNFLVRYLIHDHPVQVAIVQRVLEEALVRDDRIFLSQIVMVECYWVLRRAYRLSKKDTLEALLMVVDDTHFVVEMVDQVREALYKTQSTHGSFANHLIALKAREHGVQNTLTFDKALRNHATFKVFSTD